MEEKYTASNGIVIDEAFWESVKGREHTEAEAQAIGEWKNHMNVQALVKMYPPKKKH